MKSFIKILRVTFKILIALIILVVVGFIGFLVYSTITDYTPPRIESAQQQKEGGSKSVVPQTLSFLTWNIGYCSLGKEMDFFYDGGKAVMADEENYQRYMNGIYNYLARYDSVDFLFIQEVDQDARRTYHTDQTAILRESLPDHHSAFALNYNVDFVPLPITQPMGLVRSGLMSFSRYKPVTAQRYGFQLNYSWPMKVFMLDRCFILERIPLTGGKELVVINTHNSAYADSELLRMHELWTLRSIMLCEYEKGNYVIAGGDWNQSPWDHDKLKFEGKYKRADAQTVIEKDFFPPSWQWVYDRRYPTNRQVNEAYQEGKTPTSIIDFFLCSPNVAVEEVRTIPTGFEFSDHMPVYMRIRLISNPLELCPDACNEAIQSLLDSIQNIQKPGTNYHSTIRETESGNDRFIQRK